MVNTTVKYLAEDVRASEASLTTQKQFSERIFSSGTYELWTHYLEPATSQALGRAVDSLRKDIEPQMTDDRLNAGFTVPPACIFPGIVPDGRRPIVPSYSRWSYDSSGTAFSGGAATPSSEVESCRPTHLRMSPPTKPLFEALHQSVVVTN